MARDVRVDVLVTCDHHTVRPIAVSPTGSVDGRCASCGAVGFTIDEPEWIWNPHLDKPADMPERVLRVAVVGSRSLHPKGGRPHAAALAVVESFVAALPPDAVVVSGGAVGPDRWAERAARARGLTVAVFLPDWERHGKRAGFVRNEQIVANADGVLAVWDGVSRGTMDTVNRAQQRGIPARVINVG